MLTHWSARRWKCNTKVVRVLSGDIMGTSETPANKTYDMGRSPGSLHCAGTNLSNRVLQQNNLQFALYKRAKVQASMHGCITRKKGRGSTHTELDTSLPSTKVMDGWAENVPEKVVANS